jgi:hypothetical protein
MRARRRMQAGAQAREDSSLKEKAMKRLHVHVAMLHVVMVRYG